MMARSSVTHSLRPSATLAAAVLAFAVAGCGGLHISTTPGPRKPVDTDSTAAAAQAESDFDKATDRAPSAKTLYAMARLYASQGKDEEAETLLRRVVTENPKFVAAYCDLAESQLRRRRVDDAVATLKSGLKVAPRDAVLLNDVGMCYLLKRDYDAALQSFVAAAAVRPDDARYRSNAAMALGMMGRYTEAASLYRQVLSPADVHYNLGVICQARNDTARAAQEFRWAEDLRKQSAAAGAAAAPAAAPAGASAQRPLVKAAAPKSAAK
jgi:tetratricopeptide (TPR) repeat protein